MTALSLSTRKATPTAIGYAGAVVTVLIWANWILATRHTAETQMTTIDLGLIRYGVPALVLAPVWWRTGLLPKGVPLRLLALMVCGSGALFFQLTTFAIQFTPASSAGILLGGSMPLATAMIGVLLFRERLDITRWLGLGGIVAGVVILLARSLYGVQISWAGFTLLPLAALLWATYTHAFRRSGLSAVQSSAIIAVWSFLIHLGLAAIFGSSLTSVPLPEIGLQLVRQGLAGCSLPRHPPGSRHDRRRLPARRRNRNGRHCSRYRDRRWRCPFHRPIRPEVCPTLKLISCRSRKGSAFQKAPGPFSVCS